MHPQNTQGQETLVIAYTFLMCQKRAITGDEEGERKSLPFVFLSFEL
jgi:hypothetical protein